MTWQLFTVIQIFAVALAAGGALFLRNRALRQRNDALLELCRQAHDELVNVTTKLTAIETTAPPEKMLQERLKGMQGTDDPVVTVRRMVIENELKPAPDFPDRLVGLLASQQPDEEEFAKRWRATREECHQLAMFLVADDPSRLQPMRQLFEVLEPLDQAYGIELPPLEVRETEPEPAAQAGGEAEAEGEALDQDALDALLNQAQGGADEARTGTG
ncbi:MAG: hypothetical protein CMQ43_02570 [Gammaproteobacteria bacterium]|nr:hypothetical protein [Gammaproteobacteria bacterium]